MMTNLVREQFVRPVRDAKQREIAEPALQSPKRDNVGKQIGHYQSPKATRCDTSVCVHQLTTDEAAPKMSPSVRVTIWGMIRITSKTDSCVRGIVDATPERYFDVKGIFDLNSVRSKIQTWENGRRDIPLRALTSL
jgi:hypothetical protein